MNSFGRLFRISIFGESHGSGLGVVIDGCPAGIPICLEDFEPDLMRRQNNYKGRTARHEADVPNIVSGVFNGYSSGSPICIMFQNRDIQSDDYQDFKTHPRPGHADFCASIKYRGFADYRGGGHFSGRLSLALCAAGIIAKKIIEPTLVQAHVAKLRGSEDFDAELEKAIEKCDSIGGIVSCEVTNIPVGWGEPFFDSLESTISHIIFAIPGVKAIEFGAGFSSAELYGSEMNDLIDNANGHTQTNNSGGILGGISNGNPLVFRVAFKPTPSIGKAQKTWNYNAKAATELCIKGRHDVCYALRTPVIVEAATAIALADMHLFNRAGL